MNTVASVIMLIGAVFVAIAAMGLHRFDDVYARIHAAGKASTLGLWLVMLGAAMRIGSLGVGALLALIGIISLLTIPAGIHIIARAAWRIGSPLSADRVEADEINTLSHAPQHGPTEVG